MKSSVHPKYKTKYHVGNWPAYDRALVQRGDITVWLAPDAIATWEAVGVGKRGGQRQYSDLAIETALTLRLIFHLPLRQTEGFLTSIFGMLGLELSAPDHTTLSRRGQHLDLPLRRAPAGAGLYLMVDSTGLSIVGEGEWAAAKHGGRRRRGWKKLHLGVDRSSPGPSGVIVARALTEASVDDATTGITLIEATDGALGRVTADTAYDTVGFYEAAGARGATVVVPPTSTANVSRYGPRSSARDRTILAVKERGRRRWKKTSGYHGQARVENAFFRYKSIIGDSLRACSPAGRGTEVDLAAYNAQAAVDADGSQLVLGARVSVCASDRNELVADVDAIPAAVGAADRVLADSGYATGSEVSQLAGRGVEVLVATGAEGQRRQHDFRPEPPHPLAKEPQADWIKSMQQKMALPEHRAHYRATS